MQEKEERMRERGGRRRKRVEVKRGVGALLRGPRQGNDIKKPFMRSDRERVGTDKSAIQGREPSSPTTGVAPGGQENGEREKKGDKII